MGLFVKRLVVAAHPIFAPQVAGDPGRIGALAFQRAAVQAAAGHLRLLEAAIGGSLQGFSTSLTGIGMLVGLAMVEDVPASVQFHHPAMRVAQVIQGFALIRAPVHVQIALIHQRAAVSEPAIRPIADRVAQFMVVAGRVHEHVLPIDLADGAGLEKLMTLKRASRAVAFSREQQLRVPLDGDHILVQFNYYAAAVFQVVKAAEDGRHLGSESGIQVYTFVIINQHAGVERKFIAFAPPEQGAIGVMNVAIVGILSVRLIAHCHANRAKKVVGVIQIVPPIRPLRHVWGEQQAKTQFIHWVLVLAEDDARTRPVGQIADRSRPANIILPAKQRRIEFIVRAVDIYAIPEYIRLPVRYIFPRGKVGVECLHRSFLHCSSGLSLSV